LLLNPTSGSFFSVGFMPYPSCSNLCKYVVTR
jgi:retron-type reverse transcriptase